MKINELINNFTQEAKNCYYPNAYYTIFRKVISAINNYKLDVADETDEALRYFVNNLTFMYDSNVQTDEYRQQNGTIKQAKRFRPLSVAKDIKEDELYNKLLEAKKNQTPVKIEFSNNFHQLMKNIKYTFWNVRKEDVSKFIIALFEQIYNTQLAAGLVEGKPIQHVLWIQSANEGTGKSTALQDVVKEAKEAGLSAGTADYPSKRFADVDAYLTNHFNYIDDAFVRASDINNSIWQAIIRRGVLTQEKKNKDAVSRQMLPGGLIGLGNRSPLFDSDSFKIIQTIAVNLRNNSDDVDVVNKLVPEHSSDIFSILRINLSKREFCEAILNLLNNNKINNNNRINFDNSASHNNINDVVRSAILEKGLLEDCLEKVLDMDYKLDSISANDIMKYNGYNINEDKCYMPLRNKLLVAFEELKKAKIITLVKDPRHGVEYKKYNITALKDINWDSLYSTEELSLEEEIKATFNEYDKIEKALTPLFTPPAPDGNKPEKEIKENTNEIIINTVKEEPVKEDLTEDWEYMLDCLENSETEEEPITDEPIDEEPIFDTIPESNTTYKDQYQTAPTNRPEDQFELLNQCVGGRKQENIVCRRNFIFEVDHIDGLDNIDCLKWQIKRMKQLSNDGIINRAVFSGSKSIHCRITVNRLIETNEEYKYIWKQLNDTYFDGYADEACSNPNRLTRNPNGVRINKNGTKVQKLLYASNKVIDIADIKKKWSNYYRNVVEVNNIKKAMMAEHSPKKYETIEETVSHWKDGKGKEAVMACIDGTASYQEAQLALSSLRIYNYTWEELSRELSWVTNWDKKWRLHSFYENLVS